MSSIVKVDTIQENTSANGITVDGLNIKDSKLVTANSVVTSNITDANVTLAKLAGDSVDATKIADNAISEEHLDVTSITGHTAETSIADGDTILIHDASASALRKMTKANFVSGIGGANTPAFAARLSASLSLSDVTATDVVFNTEFFDVGSCYNASNGVFTVPSGEGGKYFIGTNINFNDGNGNTSDQLLYMHTTIGGSGNQSLIARANTVSNQTLFSELNLNYSMVIALSAGDAVKIQAYADTNNSSASGVATGGTPGKTVFFGYKIIE